MERRGCNVRRIRFSKTLAIGRILETMVSALLSPDCVVTIRFRADPAAAGTTVVIGWISPRGSVRWGFGPFWPRSDACRQSSGRN